MEKKHRMRNWLLFVVTVLVVFLLGLLASSIVERRAETAYVFKPQVKIGPHEPRNSVWGKNFPREYQSYLLTSDTTFRSKYNGSAMIDMLGVDPRLVVLWAGYSFSKDYNQGRGHYYAVTDNINILRTGGPTGPDDGPMPTTCWTCKSPDVPRIMNRDGITEFYRGRWARLGPEIVNPIGCADCHDPVTMNLVITRPALIEAFERRGMNITMATYQQMRSLVCAQCHVEYYFDKNRPGAEGAEYLTFPWDKGFSAESIEDYYDAYQFEDWTHALSRAPMLKAQHPGYEVFMTGVHAQRGVSCADCHMPYRSEGGQKFTDHHIQSPLNNIAASCQVCHREEALQLVSDVYNRQDQIIRNRDRLEELLVRAHVEAKLAWDLGATEKMMKDVLKDIRHAQWRWDYAASSHGGSFHSPVEISRVIGSAIAIAQEARLKLARVLSTLGHNEEVPYPDISTKAKAQAFIGLDMDKLREEKRQFKQNILPGWLEEARQREAGWEVTIR
ncbi:MAG: ammonia-forming cytochrome c nitrite reductase [Bacteroidales bacterium]|nr:ammonia-forming cytochrome c nitrite reductase [Bacteroidales bacterium]